MNREDENQFVESHFQLIEESDFVKEFKIQAKNIYCDNYTDNECRSRLKE